MTLPHETPLAASVAAIRAWYRLEQAFAAVNREWRVQHGVTGEQVAILRIVSEKSSWQLTELRHRLTMHPATLGQSLTRLSKKGLVSLATDADDARRKTVSLTPAGKELIGQLPLVGPVRLRTASANPQDLALLAQAFDTALDVFGLEPWAPPTTPSNQEKTP